MNKLLKQEVEAITNKICKALLDQIKARNKKIENSKEYKEFISKWLNSEEGKEYQVYEKLRKKFVKKYDLYTYNEQTAKKIATKLRQEKFSSQFEVVLINPDKRKQIKDEIILLNIQDVHVKSMINLLIKQFS